MYAFFWVITRRLDFICRRFGTPFLILVHSTHIYLPMKMEQIECSETSAYKIQTPDYYPKESIQHTEHGESLKSRHTYITMRGSRNLKFDTVSVSILQYHS